VRFAGENAPNAEHSAATQTSLGLVLSVISWTGAALLCVPVFRCSSPGHTSVTNRDNKWGREM